MHSHCTDPLGDHTDSPERIFFLLFSVVSSRSMTSCVYVGGYGLKRLFLYFKSLFFINTCRIQYYI